jgi:hypothetical protein
MPLRPAPRVRPCDAPRAAARFAGARFLPFPPCLDFTPGHSATLKRPGTVKATPAFPTGALRAVPGFVPFGESDTRAGPIDPAIHSRGWTGELIRREETAGAIEIIDGRPRKRARGRVDYLLRIAVNAETQPVAVALIDAKAENLLPGHVKTTVFDPLNRPVEVLYADGTMTGTDSN